MKPLTRPTVHLNGTSRDELQRQLEEAHAALDAAMPLLCDAAPNARDYYVQGPGAFGRAVAEHDDRLRRVRSVLDELQALVEGLWENPS